MHSGLNRVEMVTTAEFVHGTEDHIHLDDTSLAGTSGWIHIGRQTDEHWAIYHFGSNAANVLGSLVLCTLGKVESEAAYTFPVGTQVFVVFTAEHLAEFIPVDTGKITLSGGVGGSGDYRMQLIQVAPEGEESDTLDTILLPVVGKLLFLRAFDAAYPITISEAGNFYLGGAAVVLDSVTHYEMFVGTGTKWCWVGRSGAIIGPASATSGRLMAFDGTTGKKAKGITALVEDLDVAGFDLTNLGADTTFKYNGADTVVRSASPRPAQSTRAVTTFYVVGTAGVWGDAGNDSTGTGTAAFPFATIQKAIDCIPEIGAHACTINVAPGTYAETLRIPKLIAANLTIRACAYVGGVDRLYYSVGNLVVASSGTTLDVADADVVTDNEWNGAYVGVYGAASGAYGQGQIRAITDSATLNNRLTVATWETNPTTAAYYVLGGAVTVSNGASLALNLATGVKNVTFVGLCFKTSSTSNYAAIVTGAGAVTFLNCFFVAKYGVVIGYLTLGYFGHCGFFPAASGYGCVAQSGALVIQWESIAYGQAKSGEAGFYCTAGGKMVVFSTTYARHCGVGVAVDSGGEFCGDTLYNDNTADISPTTWATHIAADGGFISDRP